MKTSGRFHFAGKLSANMEEESFLTDFDVVPDTPVFARKSAPPAPSPEKTNMECLNNQSGLSTPSSSLLDTSNENSSLAANSGNPTPSPNPNRSGPDHPEPMETDANNDQVGKPEGKKIRSRSRNRRAEVKKATEAKSGPDINVLLAELEKGNPPLPPNVLQPPLPPPPPPPAPMTPTQDEDTFEPGHKSTDPSSSPSPSSSSSGSKKESASKKNVKTGKKKPAPAATASSSSSSAPGAQRTTGRIPKLPQFVRNEIPSHNRKWSASESATSLAPTSPASATTTTTTATSTASSSSSSSMTEPTPPPTSQRGEKEKGQRGPEGRPDPSGSSGTNPSRPPPFQSAYNIKPNEQDKVCLDISSFRFIPDDDKRIAIVLRKMRGDQMDKIDQTLRDNKKIIHQFPTVYSNDVTGIPLSEAPGASYLQEGSEKFISISDFASQEANTPTVFHTITRRDAIVFVIVTRPDNARGKLAWDIPTLSQCQDFSNEFISKIFDGDNLHWARTYVRSGRWGKVGTIILSTRDMEALSEFRRQFALFSYRGAAFDTHPKDALTAKADVAVLLRASMKTFRTEMIPTVLFARNQEMIAGSLRVLSTTFHSSDETSHKGESKEHWRTVDLKGDEQFMRCLRFIPENQPFFLGYDAVQIRGGLRPQEQNFAHTSGNKRPWADTPPPSVPLLTDPRNIQPSTFTPDEDSARGAAKRGRGSRGNRRGGRRGRSRSGPR